MQGPHVGVQKCTSTSRPLAFAITLADSKSACQWIGSWARAGIASNKPRTITTGDQRCRMGLPSASKSAPEGDAGKNTEPAHPRLTYRLGFRTTLLICAGSAGYAGTQMGRG